MPQVDSNKLLDAVLALQDKNEFNAFAESVARSNPNRFCSFVAGYVGEDDDQLCEVRMTDFGSEKIKAIHLIRHRTGLGLADAKRYAETAGKGFNPLFTGTRKECNEWIADTKNYGYVTQNAMGGSPMQREWPTDMTVEVVEI